MANEGGPTRYWPNRRNGGLVEGLEKGKVDGKEDVLDLYLGDGTRRRGSGLGKAGGKADQKGGDEVV